jgi:5-methylcytosine-specific restriction endonuclease McrA
VRGRNKLYYCSEECSDAFNHYHYFNFCWAGIKESIWERDGKKCVKCEKELSLEESQTDHILAVINGGSDEKENLQTLCKECHARKTGTDIRQKNRTEFLKNQTLISAFAISKEVVVNGK